MQARLKNIGVVDDDDIAILEKLQRRTRDYLAGSTIQAERSRFECTRILLSGWAVRFRSGPDGTRQIVNFLLPGDSIGLYGALFDQSDAGVEMITDGSLAEIPCAELMEAFRQSGKLAVALCWIGAQDECVLEQQIFRIGALNATRRIAHLLVELQQRMLAGGTPPAEAMTMPITQKQIAEALGISHVHANRCCRKLEKQGLVETGADGLTVLEPLELQHLCGFHKNALPPRQYLQKASALT